MRTHPMSVEEVIARHREITTDVLINCLGYQFCIVPGVFSPFIAPSGFVSLSFVSWPIFAGASVLDLGSGSGIPTCLFALNGASRVVGVDINPVAVDAGRENARRVGVSERVEFVVDDVAEALTSGEQFDFIFADLPFLKGEPKDSLEAAFYDSDLRGIEKYLNGVRHRFSVRPETRAFLCASNLEDCLTASFATRAHLESIDRLRIKLEWIDLTLAELHMKSATNS